jgi:bifunctional DNase/RNase
VALALKCNAPIFVSREVFGAHKRALEPDPGPATGGDDELRRYLKDLDPGEF